MERLKKHLDILKNPNTSEKGDFKIQPLDTEKGDYLLVDQSKRDWFPVYQEIPELLPTHLLYPDTLEVFKNQYKSQIEGLGLTFPLIDKKEDGQEAQRKHFDDFAEDGDLSYDDYENLPFWVAVDKVTSNYYNLSSEENCLVLDVGCGNGRSIERFIPPQATTIGIDISRKMLMKAAQRPNLANTLLMVGDATYPPFLEDSFDFTITSGVLSNLPDPRKTCQSMHDILKKGGCHLGLENNKSIFRLPFDILNAFFSIWKNEKGKEPEMNEKTLKAWYEGKEISIDSESLVYLPPQFFSKESVEKAARRLRRSDKFFQSIGFARQGGLIIFKVKKA